MRQQSDCLSEQSQQFFYFLFCFSLLFALVWTAAVCFRGLLAVFPAVVDSSPSSFSIILRLGCRSGGCYWVGDSNITRGRNVPLSICSLHWRFSFSHHQAAFVAICYKSSREMQHQQQLQNPEQLITVTIANRKQTEIELLMVNVKKSTNFSILLFGCGNHVSIFVLSSIFYFMYLFLRLFVLLLVDNVIMHDR